MKTEILHQHFLKSSGICTDTRTITKDCLFFALKGENFNGNKFTQEALNKGAYKVIIDEVDYHKKSGETILFSDVLTSLQNLASYHREYLKLPIIALTGSNGKTTSKELINAVLTQQFNTVATKGNLNNHIGVPLTLLSMDSETEIGIVEMGANHLKEIELLCEIAKPDYGYITNFGKAHLEGFGSMEGVIKGKTELYNYLNQFDKIAFVNGEDPKQIELSNSINTVLFGKEQNCNIELKGASQQLLVRFNGIDIQSNLIGLYNFHNIAAAICIGDYFKVSKENIKRAIESYTPTNNRSQLIEKGTNKIILDAYNANPSSMKVALENFKQTKGESKIAFLGDMFELGVEAEKEHQYIVDLLKESNFEKVYLIGENFFNTKYSSSQIHKFKSFNELKKELDTNTIKDSHLLIKGSRGMALERILQLDCFI